MGCLRELSRVSISLYPHTENPKQGFSSSVVTWLWQTVTNLRPGCVFRVAHPPLFLSGGILSSLLIAKQNIIWEGARVKGIVKQERDGRARIQDQQEADKAATVCVWTPPYWYQAVFLDISNHSPFLDEPTGNLMTLSHLISPCLVVFSWEQPTLNDDIIWQRHDG